MYDPTQGTIGLDVEVKDKSGYPVTGLGQKDFTLQDNGRPGTIVTFHAFDAVRARPDPPVEVILVIDELNLQEEMQLQAAQDEAEAFLRQNQGHLAQPVSIYRIRRDGAWTGSHSSADGNALAEEIAHQSAPHVSWKKPNVSVHASPLMNGKPINLNVTVSLEVLGSIAIEERRRPGRKMLFWLGPGWQIDRPIKGELRQAERRSFFRTGFWQLENKYGARLIPSYRATRFRGSSTTTIPAGISKRPAAGSSCLILVRYRFSSVVGYDFQVV